LFQAKGDAGDNTDYTDSLGTQSGNDKLVVITRSNLAGHKLRMALSLLPVRQRSLPFPTAGTMRQVRVRRYALLKAFGSSGRQPVAYCEIPHETIVCYPGETGHRINLAQTAQNGDACLV
jgi:hypothetical protein